MGYGGGGGEIGRVTLKANVTAFDDDVAKNEGYLYTTHPTYSSQVANDRLTEAVLENIGDRTRTLIDIGSGDGTSTNDLFHRHPNLTITGVEPAARAVAVAQERFPGVTFCVGSILDRDTLPSATFDLALLRGVLHHLSDPGLAIANAARLSSRVLIIEPNGLNPILKVIEKRSVYHVEHEEQSFAPSLLRQWCADAGLTVIKQTFAGFVPFFFPTGPAKVIHFFRPLLERIPIINRYFSAVVVIVAERTGTAPV
jgi:SAM-dependent methyltransferase